MSHARAHLGLPLIALCLLSCQQAAELDSPQDLDQDGYTTLEGDCDDSRSDAHPGAAEIWYDNIDQDCDGNDHDQDLDGYGIDQDCDDTLPEIHPNAQELCDQIDNDCDWQVDEDLPMEGPFFPDLDADGWGRLEDPVWACTPPPGYASVSGDCDDSSPSVHPGAAELDDLMDQDCDGLIDEHLLHEGDLVITEIAFPGWDRSEPDLGWFELENVSARAVPLQGLMLVDQGGEGFSLRSSSALLLSGERALLCDAAVAASATVPCDLSWGSGSRDTRPGASPFRPSFLGSVGLYAGAMLIDQLAWDERWPHLACQSLQLDSTLIDAGANDHLGSWCLGPSESTRTSYDSTCRVYTGTPGRSNLPCL